jgi:hypothetical protein
MRGVFTLEILFRELRSHFNAFLRVSNLDTHSLAILSLFCGLLVLSGCVASTGEKVSTGTGDSGTPLITASPMSLNFGNETVGGTASQSVTISNSGTADLSITQISVTGTGFNYSSMSLPATIQAGASTSLTVTFKPAAAGNVSGSVSITNNATSAPVVISLAGTGQSSGNVGISVSPTSLAFGSVPDENNSSLPITISNTGSEDLSVTGLAVSSGSYIWSGPSIPLTIAAGKSTIVNIEFAPKTTGSLPATLTISSNAPGPSLVVNLSGTGVGATFQLSANPTSLNFGNIDVGSSSTLDVTLSNSGNSDISISSVTASGSGYSVTGGSNVDLTPGQTTTIAVTLNPGAAGSLSGSVSVVSNAQNSPLAISLSGTGVQSGSHAVSLTWTPSTSEVIGYYVYRGTNSTGPFSKLNPSSPDANTSYKDSTVANSTTYYYYVTSVDSSEVESVPSNQVSINIP